MSYNILIVDDSTTMRQVIRKVLWVCGLGVGECYEAGNGKEALEVLERHWVDVVLCDIYMPVMDGFEFLRSLRGHTGLNDVPVVLITTEANESRLHEGLALGAQGYVRKPFKPEMIRSVLTRILGEVHEAQIPQRDEGCDF